MQLGFVIDHARCIGCHACTVACKAENDVPLGAFRTWVKYTEDGAFPEVRRSFAVLRCNQCTSAPCVEICPVRALDKRGDGIVDVDPAHCIGCKGCLQACPYDALYIGDGGTAEKCHFCAHRVERGLAPACAVVCPTEAIVPGDFHDPESVVSTMRRDHDLDARKLEAGTGPNVWYREAAPGGIDPNATSVPGGYLWSGRMPGSAVDAERFDALTREADEKAKPARTTYDVDHPPAWGWRVSAYLWTKGIAAGAALALCAIAPMGRDLTGAASVAWWALPAIGLLFLAITAVLLVADLKRPERFLKILFRPNTRSWLVRGSWFLTAYGAALVAWIAIAVRGHPFGVGSWALLAACGVLALLTAGYTGWLFGQARGRPLWMQRFLAARFMVQAVGAGAAVAILAAPLLSLPIVALDALRWTLFAKFAGDLFFGELEHRFAPPERREEYLRALALVERGPLRWRRVWFVDVVGFYGALLLLALGQEPLWGVAAVCVLVALYFEDDNLVRAGQALPIS